MAPAEQETMSMPPPITVHAVVPSVQCANSCSAPTVEFSCTRYRRCDLAEFLDCVRESRAKCIHCVGLETGMSKAHPCKVQAQISEIKFVPPTLCCNSYHRAHGFVSTPTSRKKDRLNYSTWNLRRILLHADAAEHHKTLVYMASWTAAPYHY